jgi:hypothetical protein
VTSWTVQLLTIFGVAVGAAGSFFSARLLERLKWQREEDRRWDEKRLESYVQFATSVKNYVTVAKQISAGLGLPGTSPPLDGMVGLPLLVAAGRDLGEKWESVLILGSPDVIKAAKAWGDVAWHLEWFARGRRDDAREYSQAKAEGNEASRYFYSVVRADLGVVSGLIPELAPPAWFQDGDQPPGPLAM